MEHTVLSSVEKRIRPISRASAVLATLAGIGIAYGFFVNNIYRPVIKVISVNYDTGVAVVQVGKKQKTVYADSILAVGFIGEWGIAFAGTDDKFNRLELVKNGMTYKVLATK
jgi:hypothetical protein